MTAFAVSWALLAFAPARGDAAPHHVPPTESPTTTHGPSPTRTGPNDTDIAPALPAADTSHLMLPFDVSFPGASGTSLFDINDRGAVVGNYLTADGNLDGFVFQDGKFTDFTLPGATGGAELVGIGNDGNSVGDFGDG